MIFNHLLCKRPLEYMVIMLIINIKKVIDQGLALIDLLL